MRSICSVPDCNRRADVRGLCNGHHARKVAVGDPGPAFPSTTEERFWAKVNKDGPTQPHMGTPCWVWTGSTRPPFGYGCFHDGTRNEGAHRFSVRLAVGDIPAGMVVCHRCDHAPCVNPAHLFVGTQKQNSADAKGKGRLVIPTPRSGERHPMARLSETDVLAIRRLRCEGEMLKIIASKFRISYSTAQSIASGRLWPTVPME